MGEPVSDGEEYTVFPEDLVGKYRSKKEVDEAEVQAHKAKIDAQHVGKHYIVQGKRVKILGSKNFGPNWSLIYENPDGSKGEVDAYSRLQLAAPEEHKLQTAGEAEPAAIVDAVA